MRASAAVVVTVLRKSYGRVTAVTRAVVSVTAFSHVLAYAFRFFVAPIFYCNKSNCFSIWENNSRNTVTLLFIKYLYRNYAVTFA